MTIDLTCSTCGHGHAQAVQKRNGNYLEYSVFCLRCDHAVHGWVSLPGAMRAYATFHLVGEDGWNHAKARAALALVEKGATE